MTRCVKGYWRKRYENQYIKYSYVLLSASEYSTALHLLFIFQIHDVIVLEKELTDFHCPTYRHS